MKNRIHKAMNKVIKTSAYILLSILLVSCSTDVSHYKNETPTFNIKQYFDGRLIAWGMIQDYSNQVTRRFCVEIDASWQDEKGTLAEKFYFDDGEITYRTWNLMQLGNGRYSGNAEDVVGTATGQESGFAFQWQYQLSVPIDGSVYQFDMDDWMYQIDKDKVFNRTDMNKLGVKLAEITLFFDKSKLGSQCEN